MKKSIDERIKSMNEEIAELSLDDRIAKLEEQQKTVKAELKKALLLKEKEEKRKKELELVAEAKELLEKAKNKYMTLNNGLRISVYDYLKGEFEGA